MWEQVEQMRIRYGLWIVLTGFGLAALVSVLAIFRWNDATNAAMGISATTSLVGAVTGAFLGSRSDPWGRREQRPFASGRKRCSERQWPCCHPRAPTSSGRR
jgi:membrane associated rhomboid family serine protease